MIQVCDLKKSYGANVAVNGVAFEISKGEVFGLLGPNGAGKSTTLSLMAGLLKPDAGSITIDGKKPEHPVTRRLLGLSPQSTALYERLTAEENLVFFAKLYGLSGKHLQSQVDWALELSGLTDRRRDPVEQFSGGMKRRLNIACALVHGPSVVFLDEPTVGVDPQSRNYIFESVERLNAEGLTVVYTTHYMEEAQRLCNRIAIMDHGQILALDTVPNLIDLYGGESLLIAEFDRPPESTGALNGELIDNCLRVRSKDPFKDLAKVAEMGLPLRSVRVDRPDLESVFLSLTGRSLRD